MKSPSLRGVRGVANTQTEVIHVAAPLTRWDRGEFDLISVAGLGTAADSSDRISGKYRGSRAEAGVAGRTARARLRRRTESANRVSVGPGPVGKSPCAHRRTDCV